MKNFKILFSLFFFISSLAQSATNFPTAWNVTQTTSGLAISAGQYLGTNTSDSATAGNLGEVIESGAQTVSVAVADNYKTIASITLTAGEWDISGMVTDTGTTSLIGFAIGVATATNTNTGHVDGVNAARTVVNNTQIGATASIIPYDVKISGSTTYYLTAAVSGATASLIGSIRGRRVR